MEWFPDITRAWEEVEMVNLAVATVRHEMSDPWIPRHFRWKQCVSAWMRAFPCGGGHGQTK